MWKWRDVDVEELKLNVNVAVFKVLGFIGMGPMIRNDEEVVFRAMVKKLLGSFDLLAVCYL